jgi:hypothetical protein
MKNPTAKTVSSLATYTSVDILVPSMVSTHVKLSRDGSGSDRCTEDDTTSLGPKGRRGDRVDDGSGLFVGGLFCVSSVSIRVVSILRLD